MRSHDPLDKLSILRREDHFRDWHSLDDKRVCILCGKNFDGHDVIVSEEGNCYALRCPSRNCPSHAHQWVYPGNPLINEEAYADWWKALGDPAEVKAQAI